MTPDAFVAKWRDAGELEERSAAQEHFLDLCRLLNEPTPAQADPTGNAYGFERGAAKVSGTRGWADVWKRGHFGWKCKGRGKNLDAALVQLQRYALALENPPLLVVCDLLALTAKATSLDWAEIDPSIFGTLFEPGLDPAKRSQLGAHYTDRDKIALIVEPVVMRPLLAEWEAAKVAINEAQDRAATAKSPGARTRADTAALTSYRAFLARLRAFTVLDPACGSGNLLYLALRALEDLEQRVMIEAEALGFQREFPAVGPANVKGVEVNPYAAELARVTVWIGEIQWMRRNGFNVAPDPILKRLDTVQCRDALLDADGREAAWPAADAIVGNPPFLGTKKMIGALGEDYAGAIRRTYEGRVSPFSNLVCWWFEKARAAVVAGRAGRVRLVATNSIRGGKNRLVLDAIARDFVITEGRRTR